MIVPLQSWRSLTVLLIVPAMLIAHGATAADADRDRILELLRRGETASALPLCRDYAAAHPDDADMLYNLACLEAGLGETARAVAALRAALDLRLDALDLAADDPDLAALRGLPAFDALLDEHANRLALLAVERGVDLAVGQPAVALPLHPRTAAGAGDEVGLRLVWEPLGLQVVLDADGVWAGLAAAGATPPWQGGPGLVLTLAVPDAVRPWTSDNLWIFAFGMEKSTPLGALYLEGPGHWQRVLELDPKARLDAAGNLELRVTIPWIALRPFHPLVDPRLGLNAAVRVAAPDGDGFLVAELLPDAYRFAPTAPRRRVVPLGFDIETYPVESFVGRLAGSISRDGPLRLDLVAVSEEEGRAYLTVDVLDNRQNSVVPDGPRTGGLDLATGTTALGRDLDFSGLHSGAYQVRATLEFPGGHDAVWSTTVLHLATGWADSLAAAVAALPAGDRPTAAYVLREVEDAVAAHRPRRDPGAIATTLIDLQEMLARADRTGTILPLDGRFILVADGPEGAARLCPGFLPAAPAHTEREPVLILVDPGAGADRYTDRIERFYVHERPGRRAGERAPLILVPRPVAADLDEARAWLTWMLDRFGVERAALAGVGAAAGTALQLAAAAPERITRLAIMAGANLAPWPGADDARLAEHLAGLRRDLPVAWYDFELETSVRGQARQLRGMLTDLGLTDVTDREVRGGLNSSQAADRLVLWAEDDETPPKP